MVDWSLAAPGIAGLIGGAVLLLFVYRLRRKLDEALRKRDEESSAPRP